MPTPTLYDNMTAADGETGKKKSFIARPDTAQPPDDDVPGTGPRRRRRYRINFTS